MDKVIKPINNFNRDITAPGDKSITHRAILFSALYGGKNKISNALTGSDCLSSIECVKRLGAKVEINGCTIFIDGVKDLDFGRFPAAGEEYKSLYVGNSGTTMRLLCGMLAGNKGGGFVLDGDASIRTRPMNRVIEPLALMGADIRGTDEKKAPLYINGARLKGISYISPVPSAQVKSAVLLAGLTADGATSVTEPYKSRDHTERMLGFFGADIETDGLTATVKPSRIIPKDIAVTGDISSAAYMLVAAAAKEGGRAVVRRVGVNPTRDGILRVLKSIGAKVRLFNNTDISGEPSADVEIEYAPLDPFCIGSELIPLLIDELPALAVLGCFIKGESVVTGAGELRVKESDRIKTVVSSLCALGADITERDDGFIIKGTGELKGGGVIDTKGDHRIAMSMAVAAALSKNGGTITDADCAYISYPGFYELLEGAHN